MILNLALFFGYHVSWPFGFTGSFDWVPALITLGAAVARVRFKRRLIHVIGACVVIGLILKTVIL